MFVYILLRATSGHIYHISGNEKYLLWIGLVGRVFANGLHHTKDFKKGTWYLLV